MWGDTLLAILHVLHAPPPPLPLLLLLLLLSLSLSFSLSLSLSLPSLPPLFSELTNAKPAKFSATLHAIRYTILMFYFYVQSPFLIALQWTGKSTSDPYLSFNACSSSHGKCLTLWGAGRIGDFEFIKFIVMLSICSSIGWGVCGGGGGDRILRRKSQKSAGPMDKEQCLSPFERQGRFNFSVTFWATDIFQTFFKVAPMERRLSNKLWKVRMRERELKNANYCSEKKKRKVSLAHIAIMCSNADQVRTCTNGRLYTL